jgi:putative nucleotidyltransferase with HDIG domain
MLSGVAIYTPVDSGSNFIVKDINNSGIYLSKVNKENVLGKLATEAFPGMKEFGLFSVLQNVFKTGKPKHHPITFYKDNNMRAWFENYVFKLPSGEVVAIYNDVTSRKKSEEKIIEAKNNQEKFSNKLHKNLIDTVLALSETVEYRDKYTAGHSKNVARLACAIAEEVGLMAEKVEALRMAGILHDIGKIAIPMAILGKPEPLLEQEFELIKTHSQVGHDLIKHIEFAHPIARMVLEHHERLDGSGYPDRKKEHEILLESKILAVADVVEAMSLPRPYRKALGVTKALEEIVNNSGVKFDSDVVNSCVKLFKEKGFKIIP